MKNITLLLHLVLTATPLLATASITEDPTKMGLPLFYWHEDKFTNFGDYLSRALVERIVNAPIRCYVKKTKNQDQKLLALGSILYFANDGDILWGTGVNGKITDPKKFIFTALDVRSVRGPVTARFLQEHFNIDSPQIYGDPALLFPYFFPEFEKKANPSYEYSIILHYTDSESFPKEKYPNAMDTTQPWYEIIERILDSKFVISTALHAIVIAEAYGIPAKLLRMSDSRHNQLLKYHDYYQGTGRSSFQYATSVEEALMMGGEPHFQCDLQKLYSAFPFEFWPDTEFKHPDFSNAY